jgi:uncharacterized protein YndB with AHSA1/START domain
MTSTIMLPNAELLEQLTVTITQETIVKASIEVTFETLLEQLGPFNSRPDGVDMNMRIEPWPGGRWYRDLGDNNGHFWGNVQAIKRPTLLEIVGPLFMSYPVANNLQYRLSEENGVTLIKFHHKAFGVIPDEHKNGMVKGWGHMADSLRKRAEAKAKR